MKPNDAADTENQSETLREIFLRSVIDWKSDVTPSPEAIDHYRKQIDDYRRNIGAKRALLVFVTRANIIEVT